MRRSRKITLAGVGVLGIAATALFWPRLPSGVAHALDDAETFEVLSVVPEPAGSDGTTSPTDFRGHRVLGRTTVADPAVRRRLAAALRSGVSSDLTTTPNCFAPRLGLRLVRGGHVTELLVCFGCRKAYAWQDGDPAGHWVTDRSPRPVFDAVLTAAGVPQAPDDD